jgi:hypothetical protein
MPRGRDLQSHHRDLLESCCAGWDQLHRYEQVLPDPLLSEWGLHRKQPGGLRGNRSVPWGRHLQSGDRGVLQPDAAGWDHLQRDGHLLQWNLYQYPDRYKQLWHLWQRLRIGAKLL